MSQLARMGASFRSTSMSSNTAAATAAAAVAATTKEMNRNPSLDPGAVFGAEPDGIPMPTDVGPAGMTVLHLFQVLSPKLADRARFFGSKVCDCFCVRKE